MYNPNFSITPKTNNLIAKIEVAKVKIDGALILPEQEIALRYKAAIESVHSSTSIEGNPLNSNQVKQALAGKLNSWERSVIEVTNYKKAWDWVIANVKTSKSLNLKSILSLHGLVMKELLPAEKTGQLRLGPIYIVDIIDKQEVLKYTGPDQNQLIDLINDLLIWTKQNPLKLHPVLLAGIFHYEFVSIHPFSDGNGRVTRLLSKYLLDQAGYNFRGGLVLDKYYWQNQTKYYEALNQANNYQDQRNIDINPWLDYFVSGFYEIASELEEQVNSLQYLKSKNLEIRLNTDEIQILDYLYQFGQANLQDIMDILAIPERTIQRRLKGLADNKLIEKVGKSKKTTYILK